jgi:hypothetical protein
MAEQDTRQATKPGYYDVQSVVDIDSENFKYGLGYYNGKYQDPWFFFQDPLLPTYDIVLDTERSPLLLTHTGDTYRNGLCNFLNDYNDIYSIRARGKIYDEFIKTLYTLFNTEFNQKERNKSYYINSITGLDKLTARIVDFEKEKITITLNEDVSMVALYLSQLYNNLSYSYRDQHQMIPANLLRFNMYVKVRDVRNMPLYLPDGTGTTLSFEHSYVIYFLRDCTFDFKKAKNFEDNLTAGGFDAGAPTKPSTISFDVTYKSIEIESEFPLIMDNFENGSSALKLNNKDKDVLGYINGQYTDADNSYGLNSVFINNYKSPDSILDKFYKDYNRGKDNPTERVWDSDVVVNKGQDPKWVSASSSDTVPEVINNNRTDTLDNKSVVDKDKTMTKEELDNYKSDTLSQKSVVDPDKIMTEEQLDNFRSDELNDWHLYDPSVFEGQWNMGFGYSEPELEALRNSFMNEINLGGFLWNLPEYIINFFLGGLHGINPLLPIYIDTYAPDIRGLNYIHTYENKPFINQSPDIIITGHTDQGIGLNGETIDTNANPHGTISGHIDTTIHPKQPLTGHIDTTIKPKPPFNEFIPFALRPRIPLSGRIDTSFKIQSPLFGYIDTTVRPHGQVLGIIDMTIKPRPPLNERIDTTPRPHDATLGYLYQNSPFVRNANLGVLYVGVTHDNIPLITYLYGKTTKFNDLSNYRAYNNVANESKPLNNIKIDQTVRDIAPFVETRDYNNNIDVEKTLNDLILYNNNVNKINNLNLLTVVKEIPQEKVFNPTRLYTNAEFNRVLETVYLYPKVSSTKTLKEETLYEKVFTNKTLNKEYILATSRFIPEVELGKIDLTIEKTSPVKLGSVYPEVESVTKKLLVPEKLFQPKERKFNDLGNVYTNPKNDTNLINPLKPIIVDVTLKEEDEYPVRLNKSDKIEQKIPIEKEIDLGSIDQSSLNEKRSGLKDSDNIRPNEIKEKQGLNNERLR